MTDSMVFCINNPLEFHEFSKAFTLVTSTLQFHAIHTMLRLGTRICPDVLEVAPWLLQKPCLPEAPQVTWNAKIGGDFFGGSHVPCLVSISGDLQIAWTYEFQLCTNKLVPKFCACAFVTSSLSKNWSPFTPRKTTIGKADHPFVPETSHKTWANFPLPHWIPGGYLNLSSCTQPKMQTQAACPEFLVWLFKDCKRKLQDTSRILDV